jgi:DNA-binding response OmpR family regulator
MTRILVVEDDRDIADLIVHYIEKAGWQAHVATSGSEGLAQARHTLPDCLVLDVMLPGMDGLEVCRALRSESATAAVPIIMLTARGEETDRIVGLELGADDYLAKPFSPGELVARIRALLRRTHRTATSEPHIGFGDITMDLSRHSVVDHGREIKLTAKEFMLLQYFLQHRGRVLSRDLLLSDVWGYRYTGGTRTVDVHVRRLREKLPALVTALVTVKQFGYKLADE